jgi:hypothetical protein
MLLVEIASQDPAAPSWEFLQVRIHLPALVCHPMCCTSSDGQNYRSKSSRIMLRLTQACWDKLKGHAAGSSTALDGAQLLRVIAHAAARFPPAQASKLSRELLKVCLLPG